LTLNNIGNIPIVLFGNKIDKRDACSESKLRSVFKLDRPQGSTQSKQHFGHDIEVFMGSVVQNLGFREALEWLARKIE